MSCIKIHEHKNSNPNVESQDNSIYTQMPFKLYYFLHIVPGTWPSECIAICSQWKWGKKSSHFAFFIQTMVWSLVSVMLIFVFIWFLSCEINKIRHVNKWINDGLMRKAFAHCTKQWRIYVWTLSAMHESSANTVQC